MSKANQRYTVITFDDPKKEEKLEKIFAQRRKHEHQTAGDRGYIPQGVGVTDLKKLKR